MLSAVTLTLGATAARVAVPAIEACGAVWDPGSGTIVRVAASDVRSLAVFRRLCVRLESRGAVAPGWLLLARFPETIWASDRPVVLFWFDGVAASDLRPAAEVLEELGWSSLWTPPPGSDGVEDAGIVAGGMLRTDGDGSPWSTAPSASGRYRPGAFRGHARPRPDGSVGAISCGSDPLRGVPAWVFGDATAALRGLVRDGMARMAAVR